MEERYKMIKWISAATPPQCNDYKKYLVTCKYDSIDNINGRKTMLMTYEEKGRKRVPTWCWNGKISIWEVLFWAEMPEPCQDEIK